MLIYEPLAEVPGPYYFDADATYGSLKAVIDAAYGIVHSFGYGHGIDVYSVRSEYPVGRLYRTSSESGERKVKAGGAYRVGKKSSRKMRHRR